MCGAGAMKQRAVGTRHDTQTSAPPSKTLPLLLVVRWQTAGTYYFMVIVLEFFWSSSRPGARWRSGSTERDEKTPQNPPTPSAHAVPVASARQHLT